MKFDDRLFARLYELNMPQTGLAKKLEFGRYTNGKLEKIELLNVKRASSNETRRHFGSGLCVCSA